MKSLRGSLVWMRAVPTRGKFCFPLAGGWRRRSAAALRRPRRANSRCFISCCNFQQETQYFKMLLFPEVLCMCEGPATLELLEKRGCTGARYPQPHLSVDRTWGPRAIPQRVGTPNADVPCPKSQGPSLLQSQWEIPYPGWKGERMKRLAPRGAADSPGTLQGQILEGTLLRHFWDTSWKAEALVEPPHGEW